MTTTTIPNTTTTTTGSHGDLPTGQILVGDAYEILQHLPSESVDTVITSPPYYRLRDYGVPGQLGLEPTASDYSDRLVATINEVGRVLKPTGSLWLNLGDSYSRHPRHGAPAKSLLLTPERVLGALAVHGWLVRNKIVWAKSNPMPHSVKDRLSASWEPLYLLTRSAHYYFDLDPIRIPARTSLNHPTIARPDTKYATTPGIRPVWSGPLAGTNSGLNAMKAAGRAAHPAGKNPGDVWTFPTAGYRGAHFATFPEALLERPLLAACPERVCRSCGTPWWPTPVSPNDPSPTVRQFRKSCACVDPTWQPGVVLDPYMGAGTTGLVAERLGRRWVGIELNADFAAQATRRINTAHRRSKP